MYLYGFKKDYSDIDVVVQNLDGLPELVRYKTDSAFSRSGDRAFGFIADKKLDVFIEKELPEFQVKGGFKVQTIESMIAYYEKIFPVVKEHWKEGIIKNLNLLK